jgi:hypothetical protein
MLRALLGQCKCSIDVDTASLHGILAFIFYLVGLIMLLVLRRKRIYYRLR